MRNDEIVQNVLNIFLHYMKWKPVWKTCFWVKLAAYEAAKVTERDSGTWLVF